ncbi:hypothetical protein SAMN02745751_03047 [Dethiosulfatibacter aminovorans DSM 17477]|uniref:FAD/NAD(P)-binding domain-containing protein n=1 Tax=Dethiosulfatibacter aminovorans DSM 17477 TaxID=1121476 RepID=A0A1M6L1X2_9FIRM|nr:FAD-dependent oxidoreductase [Dethiosulfatibacter aminovorans]SHJ65112.1 hypothetical protein SAMN02745751_03047 [Dethiosulfatibacter aminovorans DSM 17477]
MIRISNIKLNPMQNEKSLEKKICKLLNVKPHEIISWEIYRKSIDARRSDSIFVVYAVNVTVKDERKVMKGKKNRDIQVAGRKSYDFECAYSGDKRPVIVGAGPAGLFCALLLCRNGARPLIIERGKKVEDRIKDIDRFWNEGKLDAESNVQFGEGGAGTFSDGKLNTLVKDRGNRGRKVLEEMVKAGAPEEIMYDSKPHVGTDRLRQVVVNIRKEIEEAGGEFFFSEKVTDLEFEDGVVKAVTTDKGRYESEAVVLAVGHSARDTFEMLKDKLELIQKPFSIGVRVEHLQKDIDMSQYGVDREEYNLPAADYKLVHHCDGGRHVYTFCMCPGGVVAGSSSEEGGVVTNGMSYYARDLENANSAVLVGITPDDFGSDDPLAGMYLQRELEEKAFKAGGEDYSAPVQLFGDFKNNVVSRAFGSILPTYKPGTKFVNLREILPEYVADSLIEGIDAFGSKIGCFNSDDAILTGVETRSSSPVRMVRDDNMEGSIKGVFPIGEGAGYAGGIMSSAMDGIKAAEKILEMLQKFK